ncbi:MAG: hypothetical protein KA138_00040 [Saprospiraceae bacterium]|nr:hypothetical protein [Saprospiraceae bacterium]
MENFHQNIERYLLGELVGSELSEFKNALQSDATLAKSVAQHQEMLQRLDALRLRNKVKAAIEAPQATSVAMYSSRKFWAMAAALTVLVAAIWFFNRPTQPNSGIVEAPSQKSSTDTLKTPPSELPNPAPNKPQANKQIERPKEPSRLIALAREFQEMPDQTFVRGVTQVEANLSQKTPVQLAAAAFESNNFRLAADLLKDDKYVLEDEDARYIRANARFALGQFAGAAKDFDALKDSFQFRHEARWNFLLCQIALGNMEISKVLLAEMVTDQDFPFRAKAMELSGKLNL